MIDKQGGAMMFDEKSQVSLKSVLGKIITSIEIINNKRVFQSGNILVIMFGDNLGINIYDTGQNCCEERYMNTDDKLSEFVGGTLIKAELRNGGTAIGNGWEKESQFLLVTTSKGVFTVVNYNEHNGYYAGMSIEATLFLNKEDAGTWELYPQ